MTPRLPILFCFVAGTLGASARAEAQAVTVNAYGNLDYSVTNTDHGGGTTDSFASSTFDMFFKGQQGKLSMLAEVLVDIPEDNTFEFDIDRLALSYEVNDDLKVTAGRFHSAIGYLNMAYPQGAKIFMLGVARPETVSQFDDTSFLPAAAIGIQVSGRHHLSDDQILDLDVDVANGRGTSSGEIQSGVDFNAHKSLNARVTYEISDLQIGASALVDWIPPTPADAVTGMSPQPDTIREQIFSGFAAYVENPYHLVAEVFDIQHVRESATTSTLAAVGELGYAFGKLTPYVRFEMEQFRGGTDPYYALSAQQARGNVQRGGPGVNYIVSDVLVVKLEAHVNHSQVNTQYSGTLQAAFGF